MSVKRVSLVVNHNSHKGNRFFCEDNPEVNRDDSLRPNIKLRNTLNSLGIALDTHDIRPVDNSDLVIFIDMPDPKGPEFRLARRLKIPCHCILLECELLHKRNADLDLHKMFERIYTYQDRLIDNRRYYKVNYTFPLPLQNDIPIHNARDLFCVMIAGNKWARHAQELYSERIRAIRWFEQNHPDKFSLYGTEWAELHRFRKGLLRGILNNIKPIRRLFTKPYPSYRGTIEKKSTIVSRAKFSICYENALGIPGYITEKIFDCFLSGCVPVYLGADNVQDHIPNDCFIDKRLFSSYDALFQYLYSMTEVEYLGYQTRINQFLRGGKSYPFSIAHYIQTVVTGINGSSA